LVCGEKLNEILDKMPKCPICKEEIEKLCFTSKVEQTGVYDGAGWDTQNYGDWDDIKFWCPVCDKFLFTDEEKAQRFLENEN